jgi:hypothetical protein
MAQALGLRVKLGWALGVVMRPGEDGTPVVVAREELRVPPASRIFGYHEALEVPPDQRKEVIGAAAARAVDAAADLLMVAVADHAVDRLAVVVGRGVRRIPVDRVLASASLFHTAEAELLQDGFVEAAGQLGLACRRMAFADIEADPAWPEIGRLGKVVGPPWRKDHKHAATAAWIALNNEAPTAWAGS